MSFSQDNRAKAIAIKFVGEYIILRLEDTRELAVPMAWYPRLANATAKQRENWDWIGNGTGITWPDIDEDIEVQGMLEGRKSPEYHKGIQNIGKWFEEHNSKPQPPNAKTISKNIRQNPSGNFRPKLAGDPGGRSVRAGATASRKKIDDKESKN